MTNDEKLWEAIKRAAELALPSNTSEFHLRLFWNHLLAEGVTMKKRK